jgi:hypothetical protein
MLFDLRGRGRQRVVKVIYLGLALLLGGGLVLFGIGGDVQGGLFDAFSDGGGNGAKQIEERRDEARAAIKKDPQNARNYAVLADQELLLAGQSDGYDSSTNEVRGEARTHLVAAKRAWEQHLERAGDKPNSNMAARMRNALGQLGDDAGAVRAQEIVLDALAEPGFGDYAQLAFFAYQAGQNRKGDLASERATELAPKEQRADLKTQLDQAKAQAATQGAAGGQAVPPTGGSGAAGG